MSKVLVDPAALEEAAKWLEVHSSSSGSAEAFAAEALREAIAQPAEAEGVQPWRERIIAAHPKSEPGYWPDELLVAYMQPEIEELRAALSAVTAERDRLREEVTELDALRDKLSGLLSKTAVALRGPEPELTRYGYADIPLRVKTVVDEIDKLRAEVEALRVDAERWRLYRQGFSKPDVLDANADAALAAKEG